MVNERDKKKLKTISISDNTLEKAKEKAQQLGLSLSSYITYLIKKDK